MATGLRHVHNELRQRLPDRPHRPGQRRLAPTVSDAPARAGICAMRSSDAPVTRARDAVGPGRLEFAPSGNDDRTFVLYSGQLRLTTPFFLEATPASAINRTRIFALIRPSGTQAHQFDARRADSTLTVMFKTCSGNHAGDLALGLDCVNAWRGRRCVPVHRLTFDERAPVLRPLAATSSPVDPPSPSEHAAGPRTRRRS